VFAFQLSIHQNLLYLRLPRTRLWPFAPVLHPKKKKNTSNKVLNGQMESLNASTEAW
jgi:hypothetical protein